MKKYFIVLLFFIFSNLVIAQDFKAYLSLKEKDIKNLELPKGNDLSERVTKALELQNPKIKLWMNDVRNGIVKEFTNELDSFDQFTKVNFAVAYAKELYHLKRWEDIILLLSKVKADECVEPSNYFFLYGLAEFSIGRKAEANKVLDNLLEDVVTVPERYRVLAELMKKDMSEWKEDDLGWISRKMAVVRDRLDNGMGGKKTQRFQREILVKLDELIKKAENDAKGGMTTSSKKESESFPTGKNGSAKNNFNKPANDSSLPQGSAAGNAEDKLNSKIVNDWGNLPEKDRANAQQLLETRVPEKYRSTIRKYLNSINEKSSKN